MTANDSHLSSINKTSAPFRLSGSSSQKEAQSIRHQNIVSYSLPPSFPKSPLSFHKGMLEGHTRVSCPFLLFFCLKSGLAMGVRVEARRCFPPPALTRRIIPKEIKSLYLSSSPPVRHPSTMHLIEKSFQHGETEETGIKGQASASHINIPPIRTHAKSLQAFSTQGACGMPISTKYMLARLRRPGKEEVMSPTQGKRWWP